jgi:hypothetical protein
MSEIQIQVESGQIHSYQEIHIKVLYIICDRINQVERVMIISKKCEIKADYEFKFNTFE